MNDRLWAVSDTPPGRGCRTRRVVADPVLCRIAAGKLGEHWSPAQISRWLRRRFPHRPNWHLCMETIYESAYRGLIRPVTVTC
jgi:IS30 family transposase